MTFDRTTPVSLRRITLHCHQHSAAGQLRCERIDPLHDPRMCVYINGLFVTLIITTRGKLATNDDNPSVTTCATLLKAAPAACTTPLCS